MAQYAYAKTPVFCYQTFDRKSLKFTNHPVFQVYNPTPPEPPPEENPQGSGQALSPSEPTPEESPLDGADANGDGAELGEVGESESGDHDPVSLDG